MLDGDPGAISASPQVVGIPAFESAVDVIAECQREFDRAGHEAGEPDRRCDLDQDVDDLLGGQAGIQRSGDRPLICAPRTTDRKESSEPNQCCRSVIQGRTHAFWADASTRCHDPVGEPSQDVAQLLDWGAGSS